MARGKKKTVESAVELEAEPLSKKKIERSGLMLDVRSAESATWLEAHRESFLAHQALKKRRSLSARTAAQIRWDFFEIPDLQMQWMLQTRGFPKKGLVEIYGPTGTGKTSLATWLAASAIKSSGCPVLYLSGESKPMDTSRAVRFVARSEQEATRILSTIFMPEVHSAKEMEDIIDAWVETFRGQRGKGSVVADVRAVPLLVVVDPISKLLDPNEELGFYDFAGNMEPENKKKRKGANDGSNLTFSKWLTAWCRKLQTMIDVYNVAFIMVHHQNEKIDMEATNFGWAPPKSPLTKALENVTARGGRGMKTLAAMQLVVAPMDSYAKDPLTKQVTGKRLVIRPAKSSLGPTTRRMEFELREEHDGFDGPGDLLDPGFHFGVSGCEWLIEKGLLGVRASGGLYSSSRLGIDDVPADVLWDAVHADKALVEELGKSFRILGYMGSPELPDEQEEEDAPSDAEEAAA